MKKIFFILLISIAASVHPQTTSAQGAFQYGDNILAAGIGFGNSYAYNYGSQTPALSIQYEHGQWAVDGPGVISLGGYLGYKSFSYDYYSYYSESASFFIIG